VAIVIGCCTSAVIAFDFKVAQSLCHAPLADQAALASQKCYSRRRNVADMRQIGAPSRAVRRHFL